MHKFPLPLVLGRFDIGLRFFREGEKICFILFFEPGCSNYFIKPVSEILPLREFVKIYG